MHELSVCQALLDQVRQVLAENGGTEVSAITVRLGPLSGVEPKLLEQAFTLARAGTPAARARLIIEPEPVRIHCSTCNAEHETESNRLRCPACHAASNRLVSGDTLLLASVAIERPDSADEPATNNGVEHV